MDMRFIEKRKVRVSFAGLWLIVAMSAHGQSASNPVFEIAAIKENKTANDGHTHVYQHTDSGEYKAVNISLKQLLEYAYDLPERQIVGAPEWADSVHFDVEAKSSVEVDAQMKALDARSPDEARDAKRKMVRALLQERFGLKAHAETRELPVYALAVAKGGVRFKESTMGGRDIGFGVGSTRGHVNDKGCEMSILADQLAQAVGRPVVDRTAMTGRYDFAAEWLPDGLSESVPSTEGSLPSIFTAVQEQLGLKLEATKAPVPVEVVDFVTMPSPN